MDGAKQLPASCARINVVTILLRGFCLTEYFVSTNLNAYMIRTFACRDTEMLFDSHAVSRMQNIERVARRKLLMIHAASALDSLRVPPGNRLEALRGNRKGQHSIRINDQWRVCFCWKEDGVYDVEIVDYH